MLPDRSSQGDAAVAEAKAKTQLARPKLYKVLLHNDNYTTMEFVVHVLETIFHMGQAQATLVMLNVHRKGVGVAGTYTWEVADAKVREVTEAARANEFPLLCTMEEA